MADFPSSAKALDALNTLAQTLARGNASLGTSIIMSSGDGIVSPDAASGTGNVLNLAGGDNTGGTVGDTGGDVSITGGDANGGPGGSLLLAGGDSTAVAGGSLVLTPGTGAGGDGLVSITRSGIQLIERSAVPGPAITSGQGRLWLRNDAPNVLVFTDDTNNDIVLTAGGGGSSQEGVPLNSLQFYVDPSNSASYPGTGATVTDIQGNGSSGTITSATYTEGAFEFDGSSGDITFTKGAALDNIFTGGGTLIALFKARTGGESNLGRVVGTAGGTAAAVSGGGWVLRAESLSAGHLSVNFERDASGGTNGRWRIDDFTKPGASGTTRAIHAGNWVCVAITYDDSSISNDPTFYLDGFFRASTETSLPDVSLVSDAGNDIIIGNSPDDAGTWNGWIGPILFYDRVLDVNEIRDLTNVLLARYGFGLIGFDTDAAGAAGQSIVLRAGAATNSGSEAEGGDIFILAGNSTNGSGGVGGRIIMRSGDQSSGTSFGDGSTILIESGVSPTDSDVTVQVGDQSTGSTPGPLTLRGGDNYGSGFAGTVLLRAGGAFAGSRSGGSITLRAADGGELSGGGGSTSQPGGSATLRAGDGGSTGGLGGSVTVRAGNSSTQEGGDVTIQAGDGQGNSSPTGDVLLLAGSMASGIARAGNITITPGSHSGSGDVGIVDITQSGIRMAERAAVPIAAVAGAGILWVRNDAPNVLVFTDDAGTDTVLGSGGGGGESLAATLAIGNTTGGTDIVISSGDAIVTADAVTPANLNLTGGTSTSGGGDGADIILTAGDADTGGTGGGVTLDGGAGGTTGIGGALTLTGGTGGSSSGTGGAVLITGGAVGASGGTGGAVTIASAEGGPPGLLSLVGGAAGPSSGASGAEIDLTAGAGDGAGAGGAIDINAGAAGATGVGGVVTINAGAGGGTSGNGGSITLTTGSPSEGDGGSMSLVAANGVGTDRSGGTITLTAGDSTGTADGADIILNPGTAGGSGADGEVVVNGKLTVTGLIDPTGLELASQGSPPSTPTGSDGLLWVNGSAALVFTNASGDTILSSTTQLAEAASAYLGYTTSSIGAMSSTTWADLIGGAQPVTTVTDQITRNISRTNSDFTFTNGGAYQADIRVSQDSSTAQLIAIRLLGSINGTLAVYANLFEASAEEEIAINQQIEVDDGEVVTLEYVVQTGAADGWTTATLDSQALRGFTCSFYSLAKTGDVSPRTGTTITGAYTAVVGERVLYDPTGGTFTIDFPASALNGDRVSFKNVSSSTTSVTLDGNGNNVENPSTFSLGATTTASGDGLALDFEFSSAQSAWLLV